MFKDAYRNDNERIKPDDEFLEQLKKTLAQEKVVQMADVVDYNGIIGKDIEKSVTKENPSVTGMVGWKRIIGIAACFAIVCMTVYAVNREDLLQNYKVMTQLHDAVSDETAEDRMSGDEKEINLEAKQAYDTVYKLFQTYNVILYNIEAQISSDMSIDYLDELRNSQYEMSVDERDSMVANILNRKYEVVENMEAFEHAKHYVAEFENDSFVVFAVEADKYIYIREVSGVQILTYRESGR